MERKLYKSRDGNWLDGVCKGMAEYFKVDPTTMRMIWAAGSMFLPIIAIPAYLICALLIKRNPYSDDI